MEFFCITKNMIGLKKLLLSLSLVFITLCSVNSLVAQCSFTFLNSDSGCIPIPILAYANDTANVPAVTSRQWKLTNCVSGATVFTSNPGLNPNFSYIPTVAGCYNLTMTSNSANGPCVFVKSNILIADTPQMQVVQVAPTSFCAPRTVTITLNNSSSCGFIDSTRIQWGCGAIDQLVGNPTSVNHTYSGSCFPQCYDINVVAKSTCGCYSTKRVTNAVCVLNPPRANFSVDVSSGVCVNSITSHFTADSSGPAFNYCWYINGVQSQCSSSRFFTHTFNAAPSCYDIKLVVSNAAGCSDSLVRDNFICVFASPQLSFTQDTASLCVDAGQTGLLCLHNTSLPFLPLPTWRVVGGTPSVVLGPYFGENVCIPVTNPGLYEVRLIGSYGAGCTDSLVRPATFTLKQNPTPCFVASDSFTCALNLCTTFSNCSTPPGSTYQWNFGAGAVPGTSTAAAPPQVCYYGLGKRTVSLAVTAPNGCFSLLRKQDYIVVDTLKPLAYVAGNFGCVPIYVVPQSITFVPPGSPFTISNYQWSIYKDSTTTLVTTHGGSAFSYPVNSPGCYDVKLVVTTTNGCVSSTWLDKGICAGAPDTCQLTASPTTMCFEADSVAFSVTGPCRFNRLMVHYGDETDPTAYSFISNATSFVHMYQSFGEFDATVIPVMDSCEGEPMQVHITVNAPAANFESQTSCNTGDLVCLTNRSLGANRFHWNFSCAPDTFNTFSPCITLPHCDSCTVSLTAYNDTTGCIHTKTVDIQTACSGVNATFTPEFVSACDIAAIQITFTNTTPGANAGVTRWHWDDSPPTNRVGTQIDENFYPGVWTTRMVYTAPGGCVDTVYGKVVGCDFHVDFGPTSLCLPDSFHFHAAGMDTIARGVGCDSIVRWKWIFSGAAGDTSAEANPVHYYPAGSYPVKLIAYNQYGCVDSITKTVTAGTAVYTYWNVDTNICPGSTVCVTNNTSSGVALTENWEFPGSNIASFSGHTPPCLTYANTGDFPFIYTVTGGTCYRSDTAFMHVHAPQLSGYLSNNYASCPNPPVGVCGINTSQYVDSTTDVYLWDFGNREYQEVNPCDFYTQAGVYPVILTVVTDNGCRDTLIVDTVRIDGPYGTISHNPRGICACKDTVDFVISTIKATQLTFVYGCNQGFQIINPILPVGTDANPHVFDFHVPYCITDSCQPQFTLGDQTGCLVLTNDSFVYIDSPSIDIAFDNFGICLSGTVNFFDSTKYTLPPYISYTTSWNWDFGDPYDPMASNVQNPSHYYSQSGAYPVTFTIVSNFGCRDTLIRSDVVLVPKVPVAGFYADDALICAETATCFHDTSYIDTITGPQYWYWDFGDGSLDDTSGPNPCHTYMNGGFYTVSLCIYDSIGCFDCDSSFVLRVIPKPIAVAGPNVPLCYGVPTQLSGSGSSSCQWAPPGLVTNANICDPYTTIYQDTTFYLTVTDTFGCFGRDTLYATVARVIANFTAPATACSGDSICVTDGSTNINGTLVAWQYNFGNGDSLPGANICYQYNAPGTFGIIETVTDNNGCLDTALNTITVFPQPMAAFSLNDTVICSDQSICFTDLSTSITAVQTWNWDFGFNQGTYSGAAPPCHLFTAPYQPAYTVQLAITDQNQCHDTASIIVTVNETPRANFSWQPSCEDEDMNLVSTSVGGDGAIDSCIWLLWVGAPVPNTSYNCNTSFMFPPGLHDVQLVVHDLNGCLDTVVKTVQTDSLSQLQIYPGDTTICLGYPVGYTVTGVFDKITWSPNVWVSDPNSAYVTINPLGNIGYIVSASNGVCEAASDTFVIQVIQPVEILVTATPDKIVLGLSSNIATQIGGQVDSLVWSPDATLDCRTCPNPIATPTETTTYCVTAYYGKNGVVCTTPACVTITVLNNCDQSVIYVPNTFTPNGDGLNDIFMIRGIAATKVKSFRIFDRWGKLVFESLNGAANEPRWGWDGTDQGGEKLNPAVFVYTYEIECINHDVVTGNGNVTLVR